MPLQIRRGLEVERTAMAQPLASGELLYVTDSQRLYIGNGATLGGVQITGYTNEDAQDAAASLLTNGTHSGITFTYGTTQDAANRIDATIDLSSYTGSISGDLVGSVFSDNSTMLVDGTNGQIILDGTVKGHIIPNTSEAFDLGSASNRFRDLYLSGSSIRLGNAIITSSGSAVNLPSGSTVNGVPIGSGMGDGVASGQSYNISIVADDSTVIVNAATETVTAQGGFIGNLTGNVSGNVSGNLTGDVSGNVTGNVSGNVSGNVTGNLTGNVSGNVTGDLKGSVFGDDSTVLIDGTASKIRGNYENVSLSITGSTIISTEIPVDVFLNPIIKLGSAASPASVLLYSNTDTKDFTQFYGVSSASDTAGMLFRIGRGTLSVPTTVVAGDTLAVIRGEGHDGTDYRTAGEFGIIADPAGVISGGYVPGMFGANVTDGTGATISMTFSSRGTLSAPILQTGTYTVITRPSLPAAGEIIFVSDAAPGSKFQGWDGSGWVSLG